MQNLVFDIQRFSIHDGPGIRTVVFFKGCNLECPWCQNPESMDFQPEIAFYPDKCIDSLECKEVCPENAIVINAGSRIDREVCTNCGLCVENCVSGALKLIGKEMSTNEVMEEILSDLDYYKSSGGGVTFSGGEPTLHIDFIHELLIRCKAYDIHTNIETNGYFSWEKFETILPWLDLIYFDIKIVDKSENKAILSGDSEKIISNIDRLLEVEAPVQFRLPLVPGYTTTTENLSDVVFLLKTKGIDKIHLLPYHNMGESKAERIGSSRKKLNASPFSAEEIQQLQYYFEKENIATQLYR